MLVLEIHRCHENSTIGTFCEYFGSGKNDQGIIPDWKPKWFTKEEMIVPILQMIVEMI